MTYIETDETNRIPTPVTIVTRTYIKGTSANPTATALKYPHIQFLLLRYDIY